MKFQNGDIIVTRSQKWYWNFVPGYWNHCGLYLEIDSGGYIIEALPFYGVILIPVEIFLSRKQFYKVLRHPETSVGVAAAREAMPFLGRNYAILRNGETCVSLIKKAYSYATRQAIYWIKPDDFFTRLGETGLQVVFDSDQRTGVGSR